MPDAKITLPDQDRLCFELMMAPSPAAIGAALAFLVHAADTHPEQLHVCLNAPVQRVGFVTRRIVDVITGAA